MDSLNPQVGGGHHRGRQFSQKQPAGLWELTFIRLLIWGPQNFLSCPNHGMFYLDWTAWCGVSARCQACAHENKEQGALPQEGIRIRNQHSGELWENRLHQDSLSGDSIGTHT